MSEIRLDDDDKDRKYRIRVNEDGEEEIEVIELEEQQPEEEEYLDFQTDVQDEDGNGEETELMRAAREEQARLAREQAKELIEKAKQRIQEGDIQYALVALDSAQEAWEKEGEIYSLKYQLLTKNFTDFTQAEECVELGDKYTKYVPAEVKAQLCEKYSAAITAELEKKRAAAQSVAQENQAKKDERRVRFKARRGKSLRNFIAALVPFLIVLGVAIGLSTVMIYDNGIFAAAITLYVLAAIGFVASVILLRVFVRDAHRVKLNELDTSTALGREYLEYTELAQLLEKFYAIITGAVTEADTQAEAE